MAFTKNTDDMSIIRKLDDEPNDVGGLNAAQLKAKFDEAGVKLQDFINDHIDELKSASAAGNIGFDSSTQIQADNVQDAIENVQGQIVGITQGAVADGSITAAKLDDGAAGCVDIFSELTVTSTGEDSGNIISTKFMFSRVLGMMFIVGTIDFTDVYDETSLNGRFEISGDYNFGNYASVFSSDSFNGVPYVRCLPSNGSLVIEATVSDAVPTRNHDVIVDFSGWLPICSEA